MLRLAVCEPLAFLESSSSSSWYDVEEAAGTRRLESPAEDIFGVGPFASGDREPRSQMPAHSLRCHARHYPLPKT